jgi:multidrug resistance efflux pump
MPLQRILALASTDAVINARVVTVRAPIEGTVSAAAAALEIGRAYAGGAPILTISDPRIDRSAFNTLRRTRDQLQASISALMEKRQLLEARQQQLVAQLSAFRTGRVEQIENRVSEVEAQISSARARHRLAASTLERTKILRERDGIVSATTLERAVRDERVAREEIAGLQERRKALKIELDGARKGTFIGDSYNDTPQSAQRGAEVELEVAEVGVRLAAMKAELANVELAIADEQERLSSQAAVQIVATVGGRIWESLISPGEYVGKGQELFRMLGCETALVTATVGAATYQRLRIGQRATFRPRGGGPNLEGRIVSLNGPAGGSAGLAIQKVFSSDPYHVQLSFPRAAASAECDVGRTGLVVFDERDPPASGADLRPSR